MSEVLGFGKRWAAAIAVLLIGLAAPSVAAEGPAGVDPEALTILRKGTDAVKKLQRFALRSQGSIEVVLTTGQKLQYDSDMRLTIERPNKMVAAREGAASNQSLYFDGESVILFSPKEGYYAAAKAPGTLEGMLDFARVELDLSAPAADLVYPDAYEALTEGLTSGFVVGKDARVGGLSCTHLAFRKPGVDFQIWVSNDARTLPMKYVLTTTDMTSNPSYSITVTEWDLAPKIDASTFKFTAPAGARRIEFVRAQPTSAPAR